MAGTDKDLHACQFAEPHKMWVQWKDIKNIIWNTR